MVISLPLLRLFYVQTALRTLAHAFWRFSCLHRNMYQRLLSHHHSHSYQHYLLRGEHETSGFTMGGLARHKRRRRNTYQHGCNNPDGQGNSSLEGSLEPEHTKKPTASSSPTVAQEQHTKKPTASSSPTVAQAQHTELPTKLSSPLMEPSILGPNNDAAQSILKSTSTDPTKKLAASITPISSTHQKVVVQFTEEELAGFLSFLRRQKAAAHCGQGTHPPNSAAGTTTTTGTTTDSLNDATTNSTPRALPLHCNNRYIDFEKLSDFDLDHAPNAGIRQQILPPRYASNR
jgi:hypothetical protein